MDETGEGMAFLGFFKNGGSGGVVHWRVNGRGEVGSLDGMAVNLGRVVMFLSNSSTALDAAL